MEGEVPVILTREQRREALLARMRDRQQTPERSHSHPSDDGASARTPASPAAPEEPEENMCRVCRMASEPGRPLFYPCLCSGSIKYIHEDCLTTWLNHSKVKYCELCKTKYKFTPIYAPDTPQSLPVTDLVVGGFRRCWQWINVMSRFFLVLFIWGIFVPICTAWLWKFYFGSFKMTLQDFVTTLTSFQVRTLAADCCFGFVLAGSIILLLLGLSSLIEYMHLQHHQRHGHRHAHAHAHNHAHAHAHEHAAHGGVDHPPVDEAPPLEGAHDHDHDEDDHDDDDIDEEHDHDDEHEFDDDHDLAPLAADDADHAALAENRGNAGRAADQQDDDGEEEDEVFNLNALFNNIMNPPANANPELELDEIVGFTGPFSQLLEKSLIVLGCFGAVLGVLVLIPKTVGGMVVFLVKMVLGEAAAMRGVALSEEALKAIPFINSDWLVMLVGYALLLSTAFAWLMFSMMLRGRRRRGPAARRQEHPLTQAIRFMLTFLKVVVIFSIEGGTFPLFCGYVLDWCTFHLFHAPSLSASGSIVAFFHHFPIISLVVHWALGLLYMFLFACLVGWLRDELREGVLWFFRNPNADDFDPFKEMLEVSAARHARRIVVSSILYALILLILLWAPIQLCNLLFRLLPYDVWFREIYEVPLDLLVFHIVVPVTLDYLHPTRSIRSGVMWWMRSTGTLLQLTSYLFGEQPLPDAGPRDPVPWVRPPGFGWRVTLLVFGGFASALLTSFAFITLPVSVGRIVLTTVVGSTVSDLYNVAVGCYVLWAFVLLARLCSTHLRAASLRQVVTQLGKFVAVSAKWTVLAVVWLGVLPFCIGLFFELSALVPLRIASNESPALFLYHDWAVGILYLKVWYRVVSSEVVPANRFKTAFEQMRRDGIMNVNLQYALTSLTMPLLVPTLVLLSAPYVVVRGVMPYFYTYDVQAVAFRFGYAVFVALFLTYEAITSFCDWYPRFRQAVIDDKYLIGKKLNNIDEKATPIIASARPATPAADAGNAAPAAGIEGHDPAAPGQRDEVEI